MAFANRGTQVLLPTAQLPTGYTVPTVTTFSDHEYQEMWSLTVVASTVENADPPITLAAIVTALNTAAGVKAQLEWVPTNLTIFSQLTSLTSNKVVGHEDFLTNAVTTYLAQVRVYAKNP